MLSDKQKIRKLMLAIKPISEMYEELKELGIETDFLLQFGSVWLSDETMFHINHIYNQIKKDESNV